MMAIAAAALAVCSAAIFFAVPFNADRTDPAQMATLYDLFKEVWSGAGADLVAGALFSAILILPLLLPPALLLQRPWAKQRPWTGLSRPWLVAQGALAGLGALGSTLLMVVQGTGFGFGGGFPTADPLPGFGLILIYELGFAAWSVWLGAAIKTR